MTLIPIVLLFFFFFFFFSFQKDAKGVLYHGVGDVFKRIVNDEGPRTLLSGIGPRVMWISIGG